MCAHSQVTYITPWKTLTSEYVPTHRLRPVNSPVENTCLRVCAHSQVTYITPWKTPQSVCPLPGYITPWETLTSEPVPPSQVAYDTSPHGKHLHWSLCPLTGYIAPWSGRYYSLWDTGYAKIHIPIIASVSEHQPTTWVSFFFDLHILVCAFPAGVWYCVKNINDERVFCEYLIMLLVLELVLCALCVFCQGEVLRQEQQ